MSGEMFARREVPDVNSPSPLRSLRRAKPLLPPREAASDGTASIAIACERYLGGIGRTIFYELVETGEIEVVHEGRRTGVPVRQLVECLAAKIDEECRKREKRELLGK